MKAFKSTLVLCLLVSALISCQKNDTLESIESEIASCHNPGYNYNPPPPVVCSPVTVPLCTQSGTTIGTVTVGTGTDGKIYVTYDLTGTWYFKRINLYTGSDAGIPLTSSGNANTNNFNNRKTFSNDNTDSYTFVISNLPNIFTLAAHAKVAKRNQYNTSQNIWGDGCSGTEINPAGSDWATKFAYIKGTCQPPTVATQAVELCSYTLPWFFGVNMPAWPDVNGSTTGNLTVGGYNYTEAEARAIYSAAGLQDSKNGFMNVAALRLSNTNTALQTDLVLATTTIEAWLYTKGKLSPNNLPTGNVTVANAANFLNSWIQTHNCWHEE